VELYAALRRPNLRPGRTCARTCVPDTFRPSIPQSSIIDSVSELEDNPSRDVLYVCLRLPWSHSFAQTHGYSVSSPIMDHISSNSFIGSFSRHILQVPSQGQSTAILQWLDLRGIFVRVICRQSHRARRLRSPSKLYNASVFDEAPKASKSITQASTLNLHGEKSSRIENSWVPSFRQSAPPATVGLSADAGNADAGEWPNMDEGDVMQDGVGQCVSAGRRRSRR
jgi:hypothetical protein